MLDYRELIDKGLVKMSIVKEAVIDGVSIKALFGKIDDKEGDYLPSHRKVWEIIAIKGNMRKVLYLNHNTFLAQDRFNDAIKASKEENGSLLYRKETVKRPCKTCGQEVKDVYHNYDGDMRLIETNLPTK